MKPRGTVIRPRCSRPWRSHAPDRAAGPKIAVGFRTRTLQARKRHENEPFPKANPAGNQTSHNESEVAEPSTRANLHSCHASCWRTSRASCSGGTLLTFGKIMNPAILDIVAPTYFRREGSPNPDERLPRFMAYYGCSENDAKEIMKTMDMLVHGCFQIAQKAAYSGTSSNQEIEHFFEITFPGLAASTKTEIARYARSII